MALVPNTAPTKAPTVTVTRPSGSTQTRIAFNAALTRLADLSDVQFMAIDYDPNGFLTFIASDSAMYQGAAAFPVLRDGGRAEKNTTARALYLHKDALPFLKPGKYSASVRHMKSGVRVVISLIEPPSS